MVLSGQPAPLGRALAAEVAISRAEHLGFAGAAVEYARCLLLAGTDAWAAKHGKKRATRKGSKAAPIQPLLDRAIELAGRQYQIKLPGEKYPKPREISSDTVRSHKSKLTKSEKREFCDPEDMWAMKALAHSL